MLDMSSPFIICCVLRHFILSFVYVSPGSTFQPSTGIFSSSTVCKAWCCKFWNLRVLFEDDTAGQEGSAQDGLDSVPGVEILHDCMVDHTKGNEHFTSSHFDVEHYSVPFPTLQSSKQDKGPDYNCLPVLACPPDHTCPPLVLPYSDTQHAFACVLPHRWQNTTTHTHHYTEHSFTPNTHHSPVSNSPGKV